VLTVIVTTTGRYMCSVSSYCNNIDNNGKSICSANMYCHNNNEVYMQW